VRGTDAPGRTFASYRDVHVGVQVGREAVGLVPADTPAPEWALDVRYDGDFRGPAVHGKKGERFLYLTWGDVATPGSFAMFRRAKLMVNDIEPELLAGAARIDGTLVASLPLTDERGCPRCARVKPPVIGWRAG
jgi:hypothetical protein